MERRFYLRYNSRLYRLELDRNIRYYNTINLTDPDYMKAYDYEKDFDLTGARAWFFLNWESAVLLSWAYATLALLLPIIMTKVRPFKLKVSYAWWNFCLSVFSIMVFMRTAPELLMILSLPNGFHNSCCKWVIHSYAAAYWSHFMCVTKMIELFDTLFIVLRRQKLTFLHWYHHSSTLISWWYMYSAYEPNQLWYIVMNAFVHSFMYMYYFLRGINVNIPRRVAYTITCAQIGQMIVGLFINSYAFYVMIIQERMEDCDRGLYSLKVSFWMYGSFLFLFCHFFFFSYVAKRDTSVNVIEEAVRLRSFDSSSVIRPRSSIDYQAAGDSLHND